ncbi:MAG: glycosyltransferase family 1 protein [Betaproteobacteria bacterium]
MQLGINGWRIHGQRTGVGRYLYNVVRHWDAESLRRHGFDAARLYTPAPFTDLPAGHALDIRVLSPPARMLLWENLRFAPAAAEDVLFCPSYSRPLVARGRTVVALHDAMPALHPEFFGRWSNRFYSRLYSWSGHHSALVLALSEACRQDIHRGWGIPLGKIRVVHHAADDCFYPLRDRTSSTDDRMRHFDIDAPYFVFVGKMTGRRSIPLLLQAFAEFARGTALPHLLVLAGKKPTHFDLDAEIRRLGVESRVRQTGFVDDVDLNLLYNFSDALVMPARYESGSLPIMEAQRAGAPVICLDTAGTREFAGGIACMVKTMASSLLAQAMRDIATQSALRQELREAGLEHAKKFSWGRTAELTLEVLADAGRR